MQYGRNNRRATFPWVTENGSARCDLTLLAKIVCRQLHRQRCYSRVSVPKPLITKMNAHLRVQWCKKNIDVGEKKVIQSDESSSPYSQQNVKCVYGVCQVNCTFRPLFDPCSEEFQCLSFTSLLAWFMSRDQRCSQTPPLSCDEATNKDAI